MLKKIIITATFSLLVQSVLGQADPLDSILQLEETVIRGYLSDRSLLMNPTSVGIIRSEKINSQSTSTFLPAFNSLPGVRMEERSSRSYRLSIRGSLLRSPWGVRNEKFIWMNFP
jgi:iron complex outermembrane receptor protein